MASRDAHVYLSRPGVTVPKTLKLFEKRFIVAGSDSDDYYRALPSGTDVTDTVLLAIRPFVADDAVCIDVGANIGLYSLALAAVAPQGRIYAFEPSPGTFDYLCQNVEENGLANVESFKLALGDSSEGTVHFHDIPFFTAGSFSVDDGSFLTAEVLGSNFFEAAATTLDAFIAEHGIDRVDLIKIDVEGAELSVLDGAKDTLSTMQPKVVLEFNSFGFTLHQAILPQVALERIRSIFPYVYVMNRGDGSLTLLTTDTQTYAFLYDNGIRGPVDNLLCSFQDLGIRQGYAPIAIAESLAADGDAADGDAADGDAPPPDGAAELDAMRRTLSWRVTSPLRTVRTGVTRVMERLGGLRRQ